MTASMGVTELMLTTLVAPNIRNMAMPTPSRAVKMGMIAVMAEPSITHKTMKESTTPSTSVMENSGSSIWKAGPPMVTFVPSGSCCSMWWAVSTMGSSVSSVGTSVTLSERVASAARSSSEIWPCEYSNQGDCTESTSSSFSNSFSRGSISFLSAPTCSPSGTTMTAVAERAAPIGNVMWRRSSASCDDEPGISKPSSNWPRTLNPTPPSTSAASNHNSSTRTPWL